MKTEKLDDYLADLDRRGLAYHTAQLRHAYTHLIAERVINQQEFAKGFIAPAIRFMESLAQGGVTEGRDGEAGSVSEANSTRSGEA